MDYQRKTSYLMTTTTKIVTNYKTIGSITHTHTHLSSMTIFIHFVFFVPGIINLKQKKKFDCKIFFHPFFQFDEKCPVFYVSFLSLCVCACIDVWWPIIHFITDNWFFEHINHPQKKWKIHNLKNYF